MTRQMKDSSIEWIGDIPADWDVGMIGQLYSERIEKVDDFNYSPLSVTMRGILPQLSTAAKSDDHENRKHVCKNDFVINSRSDRRGSCGISELDGSVSLINTVLIPHKNMSNSFYNWLFHSCMFSDEFYKWGHGIVDDLWTTRWQDMKKIQIPLPSLSEQKKIADYLDEKCGAIDEIIVKTEQSIEEYKKLKQSVITEAVTKGVRPNRKMKDSGIEWIGEIPEDWDIRKLFQVFAQVKNKNQGMTETNLLSLSYGKIKQKNIETSFGLLPESFETYNIIDKNDIVLRLTDLQNDQKSLRVGLSTQRGIITSAYVTMRAKDPRMASFLYYLLHTFDIEKGFYGMGDGVRQGLNWDELKHLSLVLPEHEEQQQIADYLDKKCSEIDGLIEKKQQFLTELATYKKSLIYEYVTGKKEVV